MSKENIYRALFDLITKQEYPFTQSGLSLLQCDLEKVVNEKIIFKNFFEMTEEERQTRMPVILYPE